MRAGVANHPPRTTFHTASEKLFGESERSRIGTPKVTKGGQWDSDQPLPGADEARPRGSRLFSKQFRKGYSPKFVCRTLHRSPLRVARPASAALHAACEACLYMLWC